MSRRTTPPLCLSVALPFPAPISSPLTRISACRQRRRSRRPLLPRRWPEKRSGSEGGEGQREEIEREPWRRQRHNRGRTAAIEKASSAPPRGSRHSSRSLREKHDVSETQAWRRRLNRGDARGREEAGRGELCAVSQAFLMPERERESERRERRECSLFFRSRRTVDRLDAPSCCKKREKRNKRARTRARQRAANTHTQTHTPASRPSLYSEREQCTQERRWPTTVPTTAAAAMATAASPSGRPRSRGALCLCFAFFFAAFLPACSRSQPAVCAHGKERGERTKRCAEGRPRSD